MCNSLWDKKEQPLRDIAEWNGQDRRNLLGLHLEQAPKVNLESQGKEPTDNHKTPKQHTPFCLGYRTGVLESGLSADVELRERKGGWLVRNCSLVVVSREFLQWLCTMESISWDGAAWQRRL